MKDYNVRIPVVGYISLWVEAKDEVTAINKALDFDYDFNITVNGYEDVLDYYEIDAKKKLTSGNVNHFSVNEADAEEM